jgi:hypothetical protein
MSADPLPLEIFHNTPHETGLMPGCAIVESRFNKI